MTDHRYILEPYKGMNTRHRCPSCNKVRIFSRYLNTETGEVLGPNVGRCNREINCGYHYTPKQFFQDNNVGLEYPKPAPLPQPLPKPIPGRPISYIPVETFKSSLKSHDTNNFVNFLLELFGEEITNKLISQYFIGTSKHWSGATVFWQIDVKGKVRTGKIMLYDSGSGKRVKEPFSHITWVHKALKLPDFELKQCLFGEHLLKKDPFKPIAIVESEKTAIIASVYLPEFTWLAVGSLTNLTPEKCEVLKDRNVTLFPDLKCFEKWNNKAKELSSLAHFLVSDLLERKASPADKASGLDLVDYLIRFDHQAFNITDQALPETVQLYTPGSLHEKEFDDFGPLPWEIPPIEPILEKLKPENWDQEIRELELFFESTTLPEGPIKLNSYSIIQDTNKFIASHLEFVRANSGKKAYFPYLQRLLKFKEHVTTKQN